MHIYFIIMCTVYHHDVNPAGSIICDTDTSDTKVQILHFPIPAESRRRPGVLINGTGLAAYSFSLLSLATTARRIVYEVECPRSSLVSRSVAFNRDSFVFYSSFDLAGILSGSFFCSNQKICVVCYVTCEFHSLLMLLYGARR